MTFAEKSRTSFQDKLTKQNEISRQMLVRELSKLDENEKQEMRMLDTARQRFRHHYKKRGIGGITSSGSEAINVRMYETHNPGFCYHCTGEIKESGPVTSNGIIVNSDDSYEFIKSMLFTNGEVNIEKLLCLHILAAHTSNKVDCQVLEKNSSSFSNEDQGTLSGVWNIYLPCYVVEIKNDQNELKGEKLSSETRKTTMENELLRDFELSYENYARDNAKVVRALTTREMASRTLGKTPIISPHVYTIFGPSHEFLVKKSIAEASNEMRPNARRSKVERIILDSNLNNDAFERVENSMKIGSTASSSQGKKIDRSITMLKGESRKKIDDMMKILRGNDEQTTRRINETTWDELVTIKPSNTIIPNIESKNSSDKTNFHSIRQNRGSITSANSYDFTIDSSRTTRIKYRRSVYLNSPIKSFALKNREYRTIDIFVNNQIQALVHSVLEILVRVNPDKVQRVHEMARDTRKICEIFRSKETENFVKMLLGQPIVTSPKSFVISRATAIDEIDPRLEDRIADELIATTLELPATTSLGLLLEEIRENIFANIEKKSIKSMEISNGRPDLDMKGILGEEDTTNNSESSMKCKTEIIIDPHERNDDERSIEAIRDVREFDKAEGNVVDVISEKNRYRITRNSVNRRTRDKERIIDEYMILKSRLKNEKSQFKPQKVGLDVGYLDPDRMIIRRMSNSQRILVGRMCAALKNQRINNEGLIRERIPLAAIITPVLSRESIKELTRGTLYSKLAGTTKLVEEKEEQTPVAHSERLTGPVLAKVRRDIAEHETKRRLDSFFAN